MNTLGLKHKEIREFCLAKSDDSIIKKYSKYFKEGYDGYGIDDKVLKQQIETWVEKWIALDTKNCPIRWDTPFGGVSTFDFRA